MEKQVLKEKILKAVGLKQEYIDEVYNSFLNKISDVLQVSQTIKFEELGYFQLRIEPVSRLNRDSSKKSNKILIFKNIESEDQLLQENLYLTFDVEQENTETPAFSESVFNLSIDEPSTILDETKPDDSNRSDDYLEESIHDYVNQFISCGLIIDGYELLNKGSAEEIDDDETLSSDIIKEVSHNEPIVPILESEEPLNKISEAETEIEKVESKYPFDKTPSEDTNDIFEETKKETIVEKKNPFDELNDLINEAKEPQVEEKTDSEAAVYDEATSSVQSNDSGNKRLIILVLAAVFIILLTAIIYFTFAPSSTSTQMQSYIDEKADTQSEVVVKPSVKVDSTISDSSQNNETTNKAALLKEEVKEPVKQTPPKQVVKTNYTGLYRKIIKDVSISDRIYYDGQKYTVQISSWRSKTIAEHQVNKLKKSGFDAFIYRVYIKSKEGTWNRVRIGYFTSKNEASEFLKRNKL